LGQDSGRFCDDQDIIIFIEDRIFPKQGLQLLKGALLFFSINPTKKLVEE
jgi:hypothetical protein